MKLFYNLESNSFKRIVTHFENTCNYGSLICDSLQIMDVALKYFQYLEAHHFTLPMISRISNLFVLGQCVFQDCHAGYHCHEALTSNIRSSLLSLDIRQKNISPVQAKQESPHIFWCAHKWTVYCRVKRYDPIEFSVGVMFNMVNLNSCFMYKILYCNKMFSVKKYALIHILVKRNYQCYLQKVIF